MQKQLFFSLLMLCIGTTWAQMTLTGKITNKAGEGLVGVTIYEKGTNNGLYSNDDGTYTITYRDNNSVLVFENMGYAALEVMPNGKTPLDVVMADQALSVSGVEIVGTRNINRTATETPVAVEIIPIAQVTNSVGQMDLNQVLQFVAPSFNSNRQSGSDGSDHIDPATLRGLGPDQTLVLINGKRRHQSSLVNIYGTRGRGNTGTDLNSIPVAAIERIEILRDGAAAQYGSDAIAGVINIVLKKTTDEFSGNLNTGVTQKGDGENVNVNGNYGFKIGEEGYVNVTADFLHRGRTQRDAVNEDGSYYRQKFGDATMDNFSTFFNAGIPIGKHAEFYSFGGLNFRMGDAYAWTRTADSRRNVTSIYPDGFNPHILSNLSDQSFAAGVRGDVGKWKVDFSNTFGKNTFNYYVDKTLNASLESASPTKFDAGGFGQSQNSTNLSFSRYFDKVLSGFSLALGAEYRIDHYTLTAGEEASWQNYGPKIFAIDSVFTDSAHVFTGLDTTYRPGGAQGFPGFRPDNQVNEFRTNLGTYLDMELDITRALTVAAAARFERYSDFGNALTGKFALRYALTEKYALRASVNTGFRAPSLAQINFNSVYTNVVGGKVQDQYLAKNNSPVTRALGIPNLKQERSRSISAGFTAKPNTNLAFTVDAYHIVVYDRIVLTGIFEANDTTVWGNALNTIGVVGAQFFTNALTTRSTGLDAVATYTKPLTSNSRIQASLGVNLNKMTLDSIKTSEKLSGMQDVYFGAREKAFLLASAPPSKINLTLDYRVNKFGVNLRFVRFGKVTLVDWIGTDDIYKARLTTDLALSYNVTKSAALTLGGSNILNVYPTKQDIETESGGRWDPVQMGFGGAMWFARLRWKF